MQPAGLRFTTVKEQCGPVSKDPSTDDAAVFLGLKHLF